MLDYFNLNKRARTLEKIEETPVLSTLRQIAMYFGAFIGVLLSEIVREYGSGKHVKLSLSVGKVVASALIAFIIVPYVYEKLKPESPFIVQFGLFVQNGVFWSFLIDLIGKGI